MKLFNIFKRKSKEINVRLFEKNDFDLELEKLMNEQRSSLEHTYNNNFKVQEHTLSIILKTKKYASENNLESNKLILNVAGFLNICTYDLKIIGKELTFSTDQWRKKYFARQACLIIYETMNDIPELIGTDFRKEISKLKNKDVLLDELKSINKEINQFKIDNKDRLKNIRNVSIAHRDRDIFEQIKIIDSIQWQEAIKYVTTFDAILNNLASCIQKVLNETSGKLDR
ncbi:MAG: hypothetical protein JWO58_2961 [Chitinophagaceae bacterium]|nr:hypothetical protein [Chitinophagaceae bacterium]